MSSIASIAASGLAAATAQLQASAKRVADADGDNDLAGEAIQQIEASVSFAANTAVIKTDARLTAALLDITV